MKELKELIVLILCISMIVLVGCNKKDNPPAQTTFSETTTEMETKKQ